MVTTIKARPSENLKEISGCNLLSCLQCVVMFFLLLIFQVTSFGTVKTSIFILSSNLLGMGSSVAQKNWRDTREKIDWIPSSNSRCYSLLSNFYKQVHNSELDYFRTFLWSQIQTLLFQMHCLPQNVMPDPKGQCPCTLSFSAVL